MANFLKLDMADEDNLVVSTIQAETIEQALEQEYQAALDNDDFSPCHGRTRGECLNKDKNSVQWSPGDGGQYTVVLVVPDTDEGRAELDTWLDE